MTNPNNVLGPNGGIPSFNGGSYWENLTTSANFQIETGAGVFSGLGINTGGTSSAVTLYDGLSSTVTITLASPGVFTWPAHGLAAGSAVKFTTSSGGALPTGLTADTTYYVANDSNLTANAFAVSDTKAHALAGTNQINTSGSQSGTQTGWNVSNKIGAYATTSQGFLPVGAAITQGLIAISTDGGGAADLSVFYV
jgi:hypothetical protein